MPCKRLFDFSYLSGKIGGRFLAKLNDLFLDHFEEFEHFFPCDRVAFRLQIEFRVRCSIRGGTTKIRQKACQVFLRSLRHVDLPSPRVSNRTLKNQQPSLKTYNLVKAGSTRDRMQNIRDVLRFLV